jgi:hypothetical protein
LRPPARAALAPAAVCRRARAARSASRRWPEERAPAHVESRTCVHNPQPIADSRKDAKDHDIPIRRFPKYESEVSQRAPFADPQMTIAAAGSSCALTRFDSVASRDEPIQDGVGRIRSLAIVPELPDNGEIVGGLSCPDGCQWPPEPSEMPVFAKAPGVVSSSSGAACRCSESCRREYLPRADQDRPPMSRAWPFGWP